MIAVRDPSNLPESAQKIREAFAVANIEIKPPIKLPEGTGTADIPFFIFIGPRPMRWR
jgi:hypothetical protein